MWTQVYNRCKEKNLSVDNYECGHDEEENMREVMMRRRTWVRMWWGERKWRCEEEKWVRMWGGEHGWGCDKEENMSGDVRRTLVRMWGGEHEWGCEEENMSEDVIRSRTLVRMWGEKHEWGCEVTMSMDMSADMRRNRKWGGKHDCFSDTISLSVSHSSHQPPIPSQFSQWNLMYITRDRHTCLQIHRGGRTCITCHNVLLTQQFCLLKMHSILVRLVHATPSMGWQRLVAVSQPKPLENISIPGNPLRWSELRCVQPHFLFTIFLSIFSLCFEDSLTLNWLK